ncbi:AarF/ABC1/UbiB kinase family protein [Bacillus sp. HMF5848]|uniref:ABC1 kinase family protein n=1 Tax=Bacillus sp. HMF5848 TaxID=2495421 RepID=UPI000F77351C|nr:AarF/UbiB family protein [Bacillus sp. HMF5848]RSK25915.1 AarF/ABC1/UbiB kinase family protein [Bacillus sp. HMF5848]
MKHSKLYRMRKILLFAFSVFVRVYWYKFTKKPPAKWEQLWSKIGRDFRETLFDLEGLLIKIGQLLSIRADLLPNAFIKQIEDLVDHVPPSSWDDMKSVLESEWGAPIEDVLKDVNRVAVASASIGEVFKGTLKNGVEVAIKVQRPSIKEIIDIDFRSLAIIIWFADRFAPVPKGFINFKMLFQEIKRVIEREVDFKHEFDTIIKFKKRFANIGRLHIPQVFEEYSTSSVIVMEWVEGNRVTDIAFLEKNQIDRRELSRRLFRIFIPQWLEAGVFHADPHAGNVLVRADGTLVLLDFGMVGEITKRDAANFQTLLQTILLKNHPKTVEVLIDLGFLTPDADRKAIENLLKEMLAFNINELKEMDPFAIKKELSEIFYSLPVQVPTRFVFLGRSFVTIEGMLHTINPDQELVDVVKPAFLEWLNQSNQKKWKAILEWAIIQPISQFLHPVYELIEAPQRAIEQKQLMKQKELHFSMYENQKKQAFVLTVLGIISIFTGQYLASTFIYNGGLIVGSVSILGYIISSVRQIKWRRQYKR